MLIGSYTCGRIVRVLECVSYPISERTPPYARSREEGALLRVALSTSGSLANTVKRVSLEQVFRLQPSAVYYYSPPRLRLFVLRLNFADASKHEGPCGVRRVRSERRARAFRVAMTTRPPRRRRGDARRVRGRPASARVFRQRRARVPRAPVRLFARARRRHRRGRFARPHGVDRGDVAARQVRPARGGRTAVARSARPVPGVARGLPRAERRRGDPARASRRDGAS